MTALLPMLHVGDAVAEATVLDQRVLIAGITVLAAAVALIWAPRRGMRTFGGRRRPLEWARGALVALAFFAVLPSVVPYDHLVVREHAGDEADHEAHCHGAPGECADAPIPSGPGQLLGGEPLVLLPAMLSLLMLFTLAPLAGVTRRPELRPPMAAAAS